MMFIFNILDKIGEDEELESFTGAYITSLEDHIELEDVEMEDSLEEYHLTNSMMHLI